MKTMLLESITLQNFRQYYGKQTIFFAKPDESRNITVIHGENGAGKTALLNGFSWCFYNQITMAENEKLLLNERKQLELKLGETTDIFVTITFRNNSRSYTVTRMQSCKKVNENDYEVTNEYCNLEYIDEAGKTQKTDNPERLINQIMPKNLSSYFFFDGERIDKLSKMESADDVQTAVRTIMGLKMMERASAHIAKVQNRFRDELKNYGTIETQKIIDDVKQIEEDISERQSALKEKSDQQGLIDKEIAEIDARLKKLEGSKELQVLREQLESAQTKLNHDIDDINNQIKFVCSEKGHLAFSGGAIQKAKNILESKRKKGEIPSGIRQQFVTDLLEKQLCICGHPLEPGSPHYHEVEQWKDRAGSDALENSFIQTSANIKRLEDKRVELFSDLKKLMKNRSTLYKDLQNIEEQIEQIGDTFGKDKEDIGKLEKKRKELTISKSVLDQEIGGIKEQIKQLELQKQQKELELKKSEQKDEKSRIAKRRMDACSESVEVIDKILELQSVYVRDRLQEKVTMVYKKLMRKSYTAIIENNYTINVYKIFGTGRKLVDMSTGERQITSLSFLGALVDLAMEQREKHSKNDLFRGGIIPIVMDSPFGTLDEDHQARIAEGIPSLAHQIIVLVSSSQWRGIQNKMKQYVGKEYKLNYYDPTKDSSLKHEFTEVEEVTPDVTTASQETK